jgi:ribosomal protein S1
LGTIVEGEVVNKNEYSLFVKVEDLDVDAFLHCNDLTYLNNGEEELEKYKKGDKIKVKVLEVKASEQKIRVGLRQTQADPFDWFKDKSKDQTITVKVISTGQQRFNRLDLRDVKWIFKLKNQQSQLMQLMLDQADGQVEKNLTVQ